MTSEGDRSRWEARYAEARPCAGAPSAFLTRHADLIHGRVLDVAAGTGRNALFLARRGAVVDAFDISLNGLRTLQAAARSEGLAIRPVQADLEQFALPVNLYDAAINIRYLQRSLFGALQRCVKPGGVILFETFLIDHHVVRHVTNPEFLLQHGELRRAFADCDVLVYEEGTLDTEGAPAHLARLVARRRAPVH
jgi:SAM-dependent methyltransferase